jgi:hypothetical protein
MRNLRVTKAALPLLAMIGGTVAPTASARIPHLCGATTTFANKLHAFEKVYNKGASSLGQPSGKTLQAVAVYLGKAKTFFNTSTQEWAVVGKAAPSSVSVSFDNSVAQLKKTASDFGAAQRDIKHGKITAMEADVKAAEKAADGFDQALQPLIKQCT